MVQATVVPEYRAWIEQTKAIGRARSRELRALDEAIRAFHRPGAMVTKRAAVRAALDAWMSAKGSDWKSSVRNRRKAIEQLDQALGHVIRSRVLNAEEMAALREYKLAQKKTIDALFRGRRLTVKTSAVMGTAKDVTGTMSQVKQSVQTARSGQGAVTRASTSAVHAAGSAAVGPGVQQALQRFLLDMFRTESLAEVQQALGPLYTEFFAAVTPFLGLAKGGANTVRGWSSAAKQAWQRHEARGSRDAFRPGDPLAAFDAVERMMSRELHATMTTATIDTTSFTVDVVLNVTTLGASSIAAPVKGAAEALAKLFHQLFLFARDHREKEAANRLLGAGDIDMRLFETNPLLGAYFLSFAPTSVVLNFALRDFGTMGWTFKVEVLRARADTAIAKARGYVRSARYEIVGVGFDTTAANRAAIMQNAQGIAADIQQLTA
jgi:hypothetical protein